MALKPDALPSLPHVACGFAVKTALSGVGHAELQSEVRKLQRVVADQQQVMSECVRALLR